MRTWMQGKVTCLGASAGGCPSKDRRSTSATRMDASSAGACGARGREAAGASTQAGARTRRVRLVREEGRDVSSQYGREGGGGGQAARARSVLALRSERKRARREARHGEAEAELARRGVVEEDQGVRNGSSGIVRRARLSRMDHRARRGEQDRVPSRGLAAFCDDARGDGPRQRAA